jgi:hypothetical protein
MTLSSSLLSPVACCPSPWWVTLGERKPNHSSRELAYTICPKHYYKADKRTICQLSSFFIVPQSNSHTRSTIGVAIVSTALILSPGIPGPLHPILGSAYFALASAMACRVFRAVLLGIIKEPQLNTTQIVSFFRGVNNHQPGRDDDGDTTIHGTADRSAKFGIGVAVETATKVDSYGGYSLEEIKVVGNNVRHDGFDNV